MCCPQDFKTILNDKLFFLKCNRLEGRLNLNINLKFRAMLDWTKIKDNTYIAGFDLMDYTATKPLVVTIAEAKVEKVFSQKDKSKVDQIIIYLEFNGKRMQKGLLMSKRNLKTLTLVFGYEKDVEKWVGKQFALWQQIEKHFGVEGPVAKVGAVRNR